MTAVADAAEPIHFAAPGSDATDLPALIARHGPALARLIHRLSGWQQPDCDDLLQDVFVAALRHADKFEGRSALPTWLVGETLKGHFDSYLADLSGVRDGVRFWLQSESAGDDFLVVKPFVTSGMRAFDPAIRAKDLAAALADDLKPIVATPATERSAAIDRKQAELDQTMNLCDTLQAMLTAGDGRPDEPLVTRLQGWRTTARQLKEELQTKEVRLDALKQFQTRIIDARERAQVNDAVAIELKKIVDLRKAKLNDVNAAGGQGSVRAKSDHQEAEMALAEAELRLAERTAAVVLPGTVASLDQINTEIAKLSIDYAELQTQLNAVLTRLAPYDPSTATTQSVAKAAELTAVMKNDGQAQRLLGELSKKRDALRVELLRLAVVKIEPLPQ